MDGPRLEPITPHTVLRVCRIQVAEAQRRFVAPVQLSLAQAYAAGEHAWARAVYVADRPVAFVQCSFDAPHDDMGYTAMLWRLNVDANEQGRGYGRFAVRAALAEARERGHDVLAVCYVADAQGPAAFYRKLGFQPTGEHDEDQTIAAVPLR